MRNTKLITLLKTFSKEEIKEFEKFIVSPFFNKGRDLLPLYKILRKFHPDYDSKNFTMEYIFNKLFPSQTFDKKSYHHLEMLMSSMSTLCEQYLFFKASKKNISDYYQILSVEQIERGLYDYATKNILKGIDSIKNNKIEMVHFEKLNRLYETYDLTLLRNNNDSSSIDCEKIHEKHFVLYFISKTAELFELLNHHKMILNADYHPFVLEAFIKNLNSEELIRFIKKYPFENSKILELYIYILKLYLVEDDENTYWKVRNLHKKVFKLLSNDENFKMYVLFETFADNLRSIDDRKYIKEIFYIYRDQIENNILKLANEKYFHYYLYRSIAVIAVQMKQMKWAENFISEKKLLLHPDHQDSAYNFAMCYLNFHKKEFSKALDYLNKVNYDVFQYKYDYKLMLMEIYYELNYTEELLTLIDSYKHFLTTNLKVSDVNRKWQMNLVKFIKKILVIKESGDANMAKQLLNEINATKELTGKKWLKEKTEELIK
jgi:hypothetical protein